MARNKSIIKQLLRVFLSPVSSLRLWAQTPVRELENKSTKVESIEVPKKNSNKDKKDGGVKRSFRAKVYRKKFPQLAFQN